MIEELDWERGFALARQAEVDYYTVAAAATHVERQLLRRQLPELLADEDVDLLLTDEEVLVRTKPAVYRRVHLGTHEVLGWGEIDLPEQEMETEAFDASDCSLEPQIFKDMTSYSPTSKIIVLKGEKLSCITSINSLDTLRYVYFITAKLSEQFS